MGNIHRGFVSVNSSVRVFSPKYLDPFRSPLSRPSLAAIRA